MRRAHLQTRQGGQNTVVGCAVRTFKHQWCAQRTLRLGKARKSRRSPHLGGPGLLYLEATDTTAGAFSGDEHYNTGFAYGTYQTGWRYRDRPWLPPGGDARVATLGMRDIRPDDATVGITISRASFNRDARMPGFSGGASLEPVRDRTVWIAALDYRRPLLGGEVSARANWTEAAVTRSAPRERTTLMISWKRDWSF